MHPAGPSRGEAGILAEAPEPVAIDEIIAKIGVRVIIHGTAFFHKTPNNMENKNYAPTIVVEWNVSDQLR